MATTTPGGTPKARAAAEAADFVDKFNQAVLFPTIILLSAVALLVFLWGAFEYFMNANNEVERQRGARHMLFGVIGLVIMVAVWAILTIAAGTFGLEEQLTCAQDPSQAGCDSAFDLPGGGPPTP
jgi:hypothetical protein